MAHPTSRARGSPQWREQGTRSAAARSQAPAERSRGVSPVDGNIDGDNADGDNRDDRLRLLFTCCHPALSPEAQVALALRTICGLTTVDIARIFVVPEPTIGQRISRAKAKIAKAHIPYRVPEAHELPDRLRPVLATVYAVFTAGHHAPVGELDARVDLADEGIRLSRVLVELMPDEGECVGLLALTLATNARRRAGSTARARSCCSPTKTGRCGTGTRSPRPRLLSSQCCAAGDQAPIRFRRPSPASTARRRRTPTQICNRSPSCTRCWRSGGRRPSCGSTRRCRRRGRWSTRRP